VLALSTASRYPGIALAVAKANFPDEPDLGATIVLYLLVNLIIGLPYQVWQKRRAAP
jgi:BASS family bile acid:Na+ symporter